MHTAFQRAVEMVRVNGHVLRRVSVTETHPHCIAVNGLHMVSNGLLCIWLQS